MEYSKSWNPIIDEQNKINAESLFFLFKHKQDLVFIVCIIYKIERQCIISFLIYSFPLKFLMWQSSSQRHGLSISSNYTGMSGGDKMQWNVRNNVNRTGLHSRGEGWKSPHRKKKGVWENLQVLPQ